MHALEQYRSKRNFDRTPEPPPAGASGGPAAGVEKPRFVVQRHRSRRLHYDLRLEIDGVLVSWAVPRGVTLDPRARRLAVRVEDHPLDYLDFEGVIPEGEYGAGDVIVWDRGTWTLHGAHDARRALARGELHVEMFGERLRGHVVLVRTRPEDDQWLVLHKRDPFAREGWEPEAFTKSVATGRTNDEVAAQPTWTWIDGGRQAARGSRTLFAAPTEAELTALERMGATGRWHLQGANSG